MAREVSYLSPAELFSSLLAACWAASMASVDVRTRCPIRSRPHCFSLPLKASFSASVISRKCSAQDPGGSIGRSVGTGSALGQSVRTDRLHPIFTEKLDAHQL